MPDFVTSQAQLDAIYGQPAGPAVIKEIDHISGHYRRFIEASPFNSETYGAYPQYEFHHARGAEKTKTLSFQAPNLSLPQALTPFWRARQAISPATSA